MRISQCQQRQAVFFAIELCPYFFERVQYEYLLWGWKALPAALTRSVDHWQRYLHRPSAGKRCQDKVSPFFVAVHFPLTNYPAFSKEQFFQFADLSPLW